MRLNKLFLILFVLSINKNYSQPGPKRFYFYGNIYISDNNRKISFTTKDSICLFSNTSKIKLSIFEAEINSTKNNRLLKFENRLYKFIKIRSVKSEYWNERKIGAFKVIFKIEKCKKNMLVYFNFSNFEKDTKLKEFVINFKEGTFEVTDPENPKLVAIKEEE